MRLSIWLIRLVLLMVAATNGAIGQSHSLVSVGDHRLDVVREGTGGPAVVFETGLADSLNVWQAMVDTVAAYTTAVAYSRAGFGRSDPGPSDHSVPHAVTDLHELLQRLQIKPPYVLVARSYGSLISRLYVSLYPKEVAGIVLVDGTHEQQVERFGALDSTYPRKFRQYFDSVVRSLPSDSPEAAEITETVKIQAEGTVPGLKALPGIPIAVLTSMKSDESAPYVNGTARGHVVWRELHDEWFRRSRDGIHIETTHSGHDIQDDEPALVAYAIRFVVDRVRSPSADRSASPIGAQQTEVGAAAKPGSAKASLSDYEGVYAYHGGTSLMIVATDSTLFAVIDEAKYPLRSIGADRFLNAGGDTIPFPRAANGVVSGFVERNVFFPRRTRTLDPDVAADVRAIARPLGKDGAPATYRYAVPSNIDDGISTGNAATAGFDTATIAAMVRRVIDGTYPDVHSILVYRGGKLVVEEYFYAYNRNRPHQMRSATKSVISALVGIAIDRGALRNENELVTKHLPYGSYANADPRKNALTLRDLLTMQTGLACNDWDAKSPGNESRVYLSEDWVKFVLDLPMIADPGTHGSYCSGGVSVAGRIVERATGKALPEFAQENLFAPLGIHRGDYRWNYTLSSSNAATFSQLYLRPRDMLKLGILFQQQGSWNGRQVISRDWVARSTREWSTVGDQTYGYFWWHQWVMAQSPRGPRRVDMVVATGNGGQKIYLVPSLDLIVVLTGGNYNTQSPAMSILGKDLLPSLLRY